MGFVIIMCQYNSMRGGRESLLAGGAGAFGAEVATMAFDKDATFQELLANVGVGFLAPFLIALLALNMGKRNN